MNTISKIIWWIISFFFIIPGIVLTFDSPLAGFGMLITGLIVTPYVSNTFLEKLKLNISNKVKIVFLIIGLVSIGILNIQDDNKKKEKKRAEIVNKTIPIMDSLTNVALSLIEGKNIDSARTLLKKAAALGIRNQLDLPNRASTLMSDLLKLQKEQKEHAILVSISDDEYSLLKNNELTKTFSTNATLNTLILNNLYKNHNKRSNLIKLKNQKLEKERKAAARKKEEEERSLKKAMASIRKNYEKELRNKYLDAGADIKVKVTGKNYTRLILTFALFNDVWYRKLQTNGSFTNWHAMGFTRVDLKDGYKYHKYAYWEK